MTQPFTNPLIPSESTTLKTEVEDMVSNDKRFAGLSDYISEVRFFFSTVIDTACAGHGFIFFNPDFWDRLVDETRKTVVVHEIWHLILKHLERGEGHDAFIYNIAADHVINLGISADGFTWVGTKPVMNPIFKGYSTESVYNLIYRDRNDYLPPMDPNFISPEIIKDLIETVLKEDGNNVTIEGQAEANEEKLDGLNFGSTPGFNERILKETGTRIQIQSMSYPQIFADYLVDPLSGGDRTYMRPNRRSHGLKNQVLKLPGRYPKRGHLNRLTHLVYALDVSGSITPKQAQQFHDSVRTIKELLNPAKLTVLFFDTRIVLEKTFTDNEKYSNITVKAGGGTSLTDVYRRMADLDAEALVCFTDLEVTIPPKPKWDSIWFVPFQVRLPPGIYGNIYNIPQN